MIFRKFAAKRALQKIRESNPFLFECEASSNFGRLIGNPAHPAWTNFNQAPLAQAKFYFMPDKTINVVDIDFGAEYVNLVPAKWWISKLDVESYEVHFECLSFPFELVFLDLYDEEKSDKLIWFESNYGEQKTNKPRTKKIRSE